jgi:hypothetical protein
MTDRSVSKLFLVYLYISLYDFHSHQPSLDVPALQRRKKKHREIKKFDPNYPAIDLEPELKPMEFASRPCVLLKQSTN